MELAGWWLLCVTVWLACLTVVTPAEAVVAAVVAAPCAWVARAARRQIADGWRVRARWAMPVTILRDTVRVWWVAARRPGAEGRTRQVDVGTGAERAVRVAMLSMSPGAVVVDTGGERVRVHSIEP
jgi:multisubunit Na+/H+ antiporter MnhE subunit